MLLTAHLVAPHDLPEHIATHAAAMGFLNAELYLADLQQQVLVPFLAGGQPDDDHATSVLGIDTTLAGRVFQSLETLGQDDGKGGVRTWVPVLNGLERVGVLAVNIDVSSDSDEAVVRADLALLADLVAQLVTSKSRYGDAVLRLRRTAPMGLAAELQWALLPPLTFADSSVSVAAALEPAYEVAGDSVDYAVDHDAARLAVFDGMGHGLVSGQVVSLVVGAYRNARRAGRTLTETCARIDQAIEAVYGGDIFVTGVLAELDTATGLLTWVNVGHPAPLLLRKGRMVKPLEAEPRLPFGTGLRDVEVTDGGQRPLWLARPAAEQLEPGDRVLLYTDGMVEARSPEGELFGVERLTDVVLKGQAAGMPASETLRRVIRLLLEHQGTHLVDDATLLLAEWRPDHAQLEHRLPTGHGTVPGTAPNRAEPPREPSVSR
jgi:serine phosphatase RsbU (regulator of sigma subunit)